MSGHPADRSTDQPADPPADHLADFSDVPISKLLLTTFRRVGIMMRNVADAVNANEDMKPALDSIFSSKETPFFGIMLVIVALGMMVLQT